MDSGFIRDNIPAIASIAVLVYVLSVGRSLTIAS